MNKKVKIPRIIPKLDIKGPNLVKGVNLEGLRVLGDPRSFIKSYYDTDTLYRSAEGYSILTLKKYFLKNQKKSDKYKTINIC